MILLSTASAQATLQVSFAPYGTVHLTCCSWGSCSACGAGGAADEGEAVLLPALPRAEQAGGAPGWRTGRHAGCWPADNHHWGLCPIPP